MDLQHKVAVVTGSGPGLGLVYAQALASAGASVVMAVKEFGRLDMLVVAGAT